MNEQDVTRAKILGVLIRDARLHAGRSIEDCARVLNFTPEQFTRAEEGAYVVSLPQLEVLAMYLNVPMAHFWGTHTLGNTQEPNYDEMLTLRNKIVGGLLRQARLEAGRTSQDLAEALSTSVDRIQAFELGQEEISYLQLDRLARYLGLSIDYFLDDQRGPLSRHETRQKMQQRFNELPPEMQEFVAKPVNINYIQTAMRLSEMDAEKLRTIATSLLEITL